MNDDDYRHAQREFEELLKSHSDCFPITERLHAFFDRTNLRFRDHVERIRSASGFSNDLYAGLVPKLSLNGFATKRNGKYLIGINTGAEALLSIAINRIFADRYTLKGFGNPSAELEDLPPLNIFANRLELQDPESFPIGPLDPTRREIAGLVKAYAMMFLLAHEYAHIAFGHVDLLRSRGSCFTEFYEFAQSNNLLTAAQRQCLELHADRLAIQQILGAAQRSHELRERAPAELRPYLANRLIALSLAALAMQLVLRIFFGQHPVSTFTHAGFHPHPSVRIVALFGVLHVYFTHDMPELAKDFSQFIRITMLGTEAAIDHVAGKSTDGPQLATLSDSRVIERYGDLLKTLDDMMDDLARFAWPRLESHLHQDMEPSRTARKSADHDEIDYHDLSFVQALRADS